MTNWVALDPPNSSPSGINIFGQVCYKPTTGGGFQFKPTPAATSCDPGFTRMWSSVSQRGSPVSALNACLTQAVLPVPTVQAMRTSSVVQSATNGSQCFVANGAYDMEDPNTNKVFGDYGVTGQCHGTTTVDFGLGTNNPCIVGDVQSGQGPQLGCAIETMQSDLKSGDYFLAAAMNTTQVNSANSMQNYLNTMGIVAGDLDTVFAANLSTVLPAATTSSVSLEASSVGRTSSADTSADTSAGKVGAAASAPRPRARAHGA